MLVDMTLVDEYRTALKDAAECEKVLATMALQMERLKAEAELVAAQNGKNDTERKASAKLALATDPKTAELAMAIARKELDRAYALADAEAAKYALRLTIATLGAGRDQG